MDEISYISFRLPDSPYEEGESETSASIGLRTTAIALGILLAVSATLIVWQVPGIYPLGQSYEWYLLGSGITLMFLGTFIQSIQQPASRAILQYDMAPQEFVSSLPDWWQLYKKEAPHLILPATLPILFEDIKSINGPPEVHYTHGEYSGICLRLRARHVTIDSTYDRARERPIASGSSLPSSNEVFTFLAIAKKFTGYSRNSWYLLAEDKLLEHRNGTYSTQDILGFHRFSYPCGRTPDREQLLTTENQDLLGSEHKFCLEWILVRLFNNLPVHIREVETDPNIYMKFDKPRIGYWEITLDSTAPQTAPVI